MSSPLPPSSACFPRLFATALVVATVATGCASKAPMSAAAPSSTVAEMASADEPLQYATDYPSARSLAQAPAGRPWSNVAMPLDATWALLLSADARRAWEQYVALPAGERDHGAFTRTMARTEPLCRTQLQCTAEARVRTSFALQGWYEGVSLVEWRGEIWASSPRAPADCASRVAELRRDEAVGPLLAGVVCGGGKRVLEDADETASAGAWHRFLRDVRVGEPQAKR